MIYHTNRDPECWKCPSWGRAQQGFSTEGWDGSRSLSGKEGARQEGAPAAGPAADGERADGSARAGPGGRRKAWHGHSECTDPAWTLTQSLPLARCCWPRWSLPGPVPGLWTDTCEILPSAAQMPYCSLSEMRGKTQKLKREEKHLWLSKGWRAHEANATWQSRSPWERILKTPMRAPLRDTHSVFGCTYLQTQ